MIAKIEQEYIDWTGELFSRKQLDIMSIDHYVQNQGKLMMQSRENGQKPQSGQFFDDFEAKYLEIAHFSEKQVSFKLKVIFSSNVRPKNQENRYSRFCDFSTFIVP